MLYFALSKPSRHDPAQADFAFVADALQRLLRNWPEDVTNRFFPAASKAHRAMRIQLRLAGRVRLPASLLSDLSHEIAEHVAPSVRQAAVRCMRRCAQSEAAPR